RAGGRALADDDVEPEVLECRIENLLDRAVEAVDLVHEQDVVALEAGQNRRHVALTLERRAGDAANAYAQLLADDERQARLAEPGWADEKHVVESLVSPLRSVERDCELLLDPILPDELGQTARSQRLLEVVLLGHHCRRQELGRHLGRL